jgi:hypothetical protein
MFDDIKEILGVPTRKDWWEVRWMRCHRLRDSWVLQIRAAVAGTTPYLIVPRSFEDEAWVV